MNSSRSGGILLHPTSLPGRYGIGDLGPEAFRFIDWLADSGCKLWQVLPLGPTGYGDSPYQCFSAFAGNPYLISPDRLLEDGLLASSDLADLPPFSTSRVDFGRVIPWKLGLLERAFQRYQQEEPRKMKEAFEAFRLEHQEWLEDFTLFMAIKEANGGGSWLEWPASLRKREKSSLSKSARDLAGPVSRQAFYQFLFFRQWSALCDYVHQKGIEIIGDIPIFVAVDSSDVWAHPELFKLDEERHPLVVAGVPPDLFSRSGQLWGNPLYRWENHKATAYSWWRARFQAILKVVDIVRLDHFRGFAACWEIPAGNPTAEIGRWVPGPGADLFQALADGLAKVSGESRLPVIAEDLGLITSDVIEMRERFGLPGMKILQFGFSGPDNPFLPHLYPPNCVAYTGTHDNDTGRGWLKAAAPEEREFALAYLYATEKEFSWQLIRSVWSSVAMFAITPMQDVLDLGGEARMNYPSRLGNNWEWRMGEGVLSDDLKSRLKKLNALYLR